METNIKCFIDGIKPTNEMNEDELRKFSDAARYEIKRLIDMQHRAAEEYNALKAQLAEANDKLAAINAERDNATDEICENNEKIRELEQLLADANAKADSSGKYHLQYYRQCEILKKTLNALIDKYEISKGDYLTALTEGNDIDIDGLLTFLSK